MSTMRRWCLRAGELASSSKAGQCLLSFQLFPTEEFITHTDEKNDGYLARVLSRLPKARSPQGNSLNSDFRLLLTNSQPRPLRALVRLRTLLQLLTFHPCLLSRFNGGWVCKNPFVILNIKHNIRLFRMTIF